MRFDTKIGIVVRDDLAAWQRLNVTAFLASAAAAAVPETVGAPYRDGSDEIYLPMFGQPVLVFSASAAELGRARELAVARGMRSAIYTEEMFATDHDEANRAVVRSVPSADLNLVGLVVFGARNGVDKVLKGLRLHP